MNTKLLNNFFLHVCLSITVGTQNFIYFDMKRRVPMFSPFLNAPWKSFKLKVAGPFSQPPSSFQCLKIYFPEVLLHLGEQQNVTRSKVWRVGRVRGSFDAHLCQQKSFLHNKLPNCLCMSTVVKKQLQPSPSNWNIKRWQVSLLDV